MAGPKWLFQQRFQMYCHIIKSRKDLIFWTELNNFWREGREFRGFDL